MPHGWKSARIGDICKTNQRTYSVSEKWPFVNYLDTGNITENRISEIQHLVMGRGTLPSRARRKVAADDILYSTVRPNQRHYGIIQEVLPHMLVSTGFTVITADKAIADSNFIYYFLTQNDIVDSLHAIGEQSVSAYPSIKPSDIEGLELLLPPLEEQREIGRILRALDNKIANNTKINHHLEQMAQAIFKSWFVDFEPFADGGFVESELGEIPTGWRVGKIGDIVRLQRGHDLPINSTIKGDYPVVGSKGIIAFHNEYTSVAPIIVLGRSGNIGSPRYYNQNCWAHNTSIYSKELYAAPLWVYFTLRQIDYSVFKGGSAVPTLNRNHVESWKIAIPPETIQKKFHEAIAPLFLERDLLELSASRLAEIRDALLPRLMSGELSIANLGNAK